MNIRVTVAHLLVAAGLLWPTSGYAQEAARSAGDPNGHGRRILENRKQSLKGAREAASVPRWTNAGLEAYVPRTEKPWNRQRALYLLRRASFGVTKTDVDAALTKTPSQVVDELLAPRPLPAKPDVWVDSSYTYGLTRNDSINNAWMNTLRYWWTSVIIGSDASIQEKMVLFWHDHWATETQDVIQPHFNYWFLDLFRRNALGNFKQMTKDVAIAPAMLVYLDGRYNTRSRPNENYARELMELHTLGEGVGYTEDDIKAAAKALTGWRPKLINTIVISGTKYYSYHPYQSVIDSASFDKTQKTFMGQTGNWGYSDIIDIIFRERASEVAHFICRKLYRYFVYELADETIVDQLAAQLITDNWELKGVMARLLKSEHFFESANIGSHISSPAEFYVGALKAMEITPQFPSDVYSTMASLGMQLLQPPNVKGWPDYRTWITASRLSARWAATDALLDESKKTNSRLPLDVVAFIKKISTATDARRINQDVIELFLDIPLNAYQTEVLFEKFMSGWKDYEWDISNPGAADRLRLLLKAVLRNNEAQLF